MPVISCTDLSCDTGYIAEANGFGYYVPSNDVIAFTNAVDRMLASDMMSMGEKGYQFCLNNYSIGNTYDAIVSKIK
jgi:glycosyltransferase involved in cell wall biosynthesis